MKTFVECYQIELAFIIRKVEKSFSKLEQNGLYELLGIRYLLFIIKDTKKQKTKNDTLISLILISIFSSSKRTTMYFFKTT